MDIEHEDQVLSEFLCALGAWRKYVVISGGYAPIIYKLYFTDQQFGHLPIGTRDIDSLIPRRLPKISEKDVLKHLQAAGYAHIFKDLDDPATEAYVKNINGIEIEIEFLTDTASRKDKYKNVIISGVVAQPLNYVTLSLRTTIDFRTRAGIEGFVVAPGAWIFHKGLTFLKREDKNKLYKDLYGIWYVASQLGEFSKRVIDEFLFLGSKNPQWYKKFQSNLHQWCTNASPLEWSTLEFQDPMRQLTKPSFEHAIALLFNKELCKSNSPIQIDSKHGM